MILLDTKAAAVALGCSVRTVQRYIALGRLHRTRTGGLDLDEIRQLAVWLDADQLRMS